MCTVQWVQLLQCVCRRWVCCCGHAHATCTRASSCWMLAAAGQHLCMPRCRARLVCVLLKCLAAVSLVLLLLLLL